MLFLRLAMRVMALVSRHAWALAPTNCDGDTDPASPLVVDVGGDGIQLGTKGEGVYFDLLAVGTSLHLQWVRPHGDEAFLVADLNGNGRIDDGSELFGEGTMLVHRGTRARNGFIALAQYDSPSLGGNDDGLITKDDAIWSTLRLWTDSDANGRSAPGEIQTPQALGVVAFETIPRFRRHVDSAGNEIPFYAWVRKAQGKKLLMVDVFFRTIP